MEPASCARSSAWRSCSRVIWGLSWILRQVKARRDPRVAATGLTSVSALSLGSGRSVHLVRAGNDYLLLGSAEHGLMPIHRYTEEQALDSGSALAEESRAPAQRRSSAGCPGGPGVPPWPPARAPPTRCACPRCPRQLDRAPARTDGASLNLSSNNAVQILLLVAGLTLVPAILFTVTGFSRILIVLGFIRTASGPPPSHPTRCWSGSRCS